ncbi:MAG TPA: response regulator [Herpetosiphonaceae bacterium]
MTIAPLSAQVLVVDDEPDIRDLLSEVLEDEACTVTTAPYGAAALAYLHQTPTLPKLILLDVMMPVMDGIAFLHAKLADPLLKDIPVVLLSAHLRLRPEVVQLPIEAFLPKPLDYDLLVAITHRYCDT